MNLIACSRSIAYRPVSMTYGCNPETAVLAVSRVGTGKRGFPVPSEINPLTWSTSVALPCPKPSAHLSGPTLDGVFVSGF